MTPSQMAEFLQGRDRFLVLTHRRPDGDTLGCAAALCAGLRSLGKTAYLLPNAELTPTYAPYVTPYLAESGFEPETVVSVDVAARSLFPANALPYLERLDAAIDHHPSFEGFGKVQCVQAERAACGEILYDILCAMGTLNAEAALPLYVAVSTDTGCFVYSNTTDNTHRVAAELLRYPIDYRAVNKRCFRTKSRKRLQLEAAMLGSMEFFDEERIVTLAIPRSLIAAVGAGERDMEDLSALGGLVEGTDCAITLRELEPNEWKISVRTGRRINATHACGLLGGGGHRAAAGATVCGSYAEVRDRIVEACLASVE